MSSSPLSNRKVRSIAVVGGSLRARAFAAFVAIQNKTKVVWCDPRLNSLSAEAKVTVDLMGEEVRLGRLTQHSLRDLQSEALDIDLFIFVGEDSLFAVKLVEWVQEGKIQALFDREAAKADDSARTPDFRLEWEVKEKRVWDLKILSRTEILLSTSAPSSRASLFRSWGFMIERPLRQSPKPSAEWRPWSELVAGERA